MARLGHFFFWPEAATSWGGAVATHHQLLPCLHRIESCSKSQVDKRAAERKVETTTTTHRKNNRGRDDIIFRDDRDAKDCAHRDKRCLQFMTGRKWLPCSTFMPLVPGALWLQLALATGRSWWVAHVEGETDELWIHPHMLLFAAA